MANKSLIWQRAFDWGREHYPNTPEIHHEAFASVISFACESGVGRKQIIRTMRTFVAVNKIFRLRAPGSFEFNEAIKIIEQDCYGHINIDHAQAWRQSEFKDDSESDIAIAKQLISTLHPTVINNAERDQ